MKKGKADKPTAVNLKENFSSFLKSNKMRQTPERFAILDKALQQPAHFDIDILYKDIEKDYHVSRTTVYNTMELLCRCNIFRKHFINGTRTVYEPAHDSHLHLVCLECGEVKREDSHSLNEFLASMKFRGFNPVFSQTEIYGYCRNCARRQKNKI